MKILFIGNTRLGDAILSTCILNHFENKNVEVTVICSPLSREIYKNFSVVKNIISIIKKKKGKHWIEAYRALDSQVWDLIIDLRNTIISRLIRKKKVIRFGKPNKKEHRVISMCKLIKLNKICSPKIPITKNNHKKALLTLQKNNLMNPVLAIAPITNWHRKNWPLNNYAKLINKLIDSKADIKSVIILGSYNEREECEDLKKKIKIKEVVNYAGKANISEIYAILRNCKMFIGNDSGLMHLAAVSGIKTLGLFGPSKVENYSPWGDQAYFIRTTKTYDDLVLTKTYSRHDNSNLMKSLSVEKVYKKVMKII